MSTSARQAPSLRTQSNARLPPPSLAAPIAAHLAQEHDVVGVLGDPAKGAARRRGTHVGFSRVREAAWEDGVRERGTAPSEAADAPAGCTESSGMRVLSPRMLPPAGEGIESSDAVTPTQLSCGVGGSHRPRGTPCRHRTCTRRGRVDSDDGHAVTAANEVHAQHLNERALACRGDRVGRTLCAHHSFPSGSHTGSRRPRDSDSKGAVGGPASRLGAWGDRRAATRRGSRSAREKLPRPEHLVEQKPRLRTMVSPRRLDCERRGDRSRSTPAALVTVRRT